MTYYDDVSIYYNNNSYMNYQLIWVIMTLYSLKLNIITITIPCSVNMIATVTHKVYIFNALNS